MLPCKAGAARWRGDLTVRGNKMDPVTTHMVVVKVNLGKHPTPWGVHRPKAKIRSNKRTDNHRTSPVANNLEISHATFFKKGLIDLHHEGRERQRDKKPSRTCPAVQRSFLT